MSVPTKSGGGGGDRPNVVTRHKALYANFINPEYAYVDQVNGYEIAERFQAFADACMATIPDEGEPADGYMYNTHMGKFLRDLDTAKDHFLKASLAFHAKRGSGLDQ